ncbi:transmembrane protein 64-like isoform X1 [Polypterus senegalus]|uniref:transmembrane protein 64-like isoform X1 n=1 Tax=Polypterus senegalus TaxID=55291 RepID=UPI001964AD1C|nr:transmembrane protein 64-like isoform X1 [Polypterus senegalus]
MMSTREENGPGGEPRDSAVHYRNTMTVVVVQDSAELSEAAALSCVSFPKGARLQRNLLGAPLFIVVCLLVYLLLRKHLTDCLLWLERLDSTAGGLLLVAGFTVVSFPWSWGYTPLTVAAGYLFGFLRGLALVMLGVVIGTWVAHVASKRYLRSCVGAAVRGSARLRPIVRVLEGSGGLKVVFLARLTPIPFGLQNAVFSISKLDTQSYLTASSAGLLPTQILNSYVGTTLRTMEDVTNHQGLEGYLTLALQICISIFVMFFMVRQAQKELENSIQDFEDIHRGEHQKESNQPSLEPV